MCVSPVLLTCMCEQCFRPRPLPNGDCSTGPLVAHSAPCWCCNRAFLQDCAGSLSLSCIPSNPAVEGTTSETPVAEDSSRTKCCVARGLPARDFCQPQFVCSFSRQACSCLRLLMRRRSKGLSRSLRFASRRASWPCTSKRSNSISCCMKCVPGIASKATKVLQFSRVRQARGNQSRKH